MRVLLNMNYWHGMANGGARHWWDVVHAGVDARHRTNRDFRCSQGAWLGGRVTNGVSSAKADGPASESASRSRLVGQLGGEP